MTTKTLPKLISKSKILRGFQCQKSFYLSMHFRELEPKPNAELQDLFRQSAEVGEFAKNQYAQKIKTQGDEFVEVTAPAWEFVDALKSTQEFLKQQQKNIFQPAFDFKGCFGRLDYISYNSFSERWTIYEFKSATKVKDEHLTDISLQAWIAAKAGLPIEKIILVHMNSACLAPNYENLFIEVDVTEEVRQRYLRIPEKLNEIFQTARERVIPNVKIGRQCFSPNPCPFFESCQNEASLPEMNLSLIPTLYETKWDLYQDGVFDLKDPQIFQDERITDLQKKYIQAQLDQSCFYDLAAIQSALSQWQEPLLYLDFETISSAIPQWDRTRPFEQVPFQYSLLTPNEAVEFLETDSKDPRRQLAEHLVFQLTARYPQGSIVAYNAQFESQVIARLADYFSDLAPALLAIQARLVDPYPILKNHYYDYRFKNSFSLKSVAPALLGEAASYEKMALKDGLEAQRQYRRLRALAGPNSQSESQMRRDLMDYCTKDVVVLRDLVNFLKALS